jgi:hypothetical protein
VGAGRRDGRGIQSHGRHTAVQKVELRSVGLWGQGEQTPYSKEVDQRARY